MAGRKSSFTANTTCRRFASATFGQKSRRFGIALGRQIPRRRFGAIPASRPGAISVAAAIGPRGRRRSRRGRGGGFTAFQARRPCHRGHPPRRSGRLETARGLGNLSRNIAIPGHQAFGSYAQYLVRDEAMWLPLPDGVDDEQAGVTLWPFSSSHRICTIGSGCELGDTCWSPAPPAAWVRPPCNYASWPARACSRRRAMP